ncbi:MAG: DEAD/DEAH box helicase [Thermoguttaceae bacterium]
MPTASRDELASRYFDQLPFQPYKVQEEALLAWFSAEQGVLVCAPTGTGKTLIAEAALFEALHTGSVAYYTTPLIALTEQKFHEMQERAVAWGFQATDVGLVTGNRRENPAASVLVVVAEILLNRLLHSEFDFSRTSAVVMDEFHSFADPERGIVWELTLGLLPPHVRTLLLSATVGNAMDFIHWLRLSHNRKIELVRGEERKVPLTYHWVGDMLLSEQLEAMAAGEGEARGLPALVFCFNRDECWTVAEQIKGKRVLTDGQQARLVEELGRFDWSQGAGTKLRQLLLRGVAVHHAGLLPKYRRTVEELFQRKLLSVAICTETLSSGINLPARSVVLPSILKGPPMKKRIMEASAAHQIFGRAGRPQFDTQGHVFVLAHEDDVKIARWREQYDRIPEDTKDPGLLKAKKALKRKMPHRRENEQYWNEAQFRKLVAAPPGKLHSRGPLPWRLLAYMLDASPEIDVIRRLVGKRLMDPPFLERGQRELERMLLVLHRAGYVRLEPAPPEGGEEGGGRKAEGGEEGGGGKAEGGGLSQFSSDENGTVPFKAEGGRRKAEGGIAAPPATDTLGAVPAAGAPPAVSLPPSALRLPPSQPPSAFRLPPSPLPLPPSGILLPPSAVAAHPSSLPLPPSALPPPYKPVLAHPTAALPKLALFRSVNPLYGIFLVEQLGVADRRERIQAWESVLDFPAPVARFVRVPKQHEMPPGPLATTRLDAQLLQLGLAAPEELAEQPAEEAEPRRPRRSYDAEQDEEPKWVLTVAEKLRRLFDYQHPGVDDLRTRSVWAAGELLLEFNGNFNKYAHSKDLLKQEGILFRHMLRLILLLDEFRPLCPPDLDPAAWQYELDEIVEQLTRSCREVDPASTDLALEKPGEEPDEAEQFGAGIFE